VSLFVPCPSCRLDFLTLQRHLTTVATFHSLPAKTPRTRPLPEQRVWLACLAGVIAWVYTSKVDGRVECRKSSCMTLNSVPTLLKTVEYV
jgi:hypothetical protein